MAAYVASLEARCYGNVVDDCEALIGALPDDLDDPSVSYNEDQRMLMVQLKLDAEDGRDALDAALEVWDAAWEDAFPGMAPSAVLIVKCVPGRLAGQAAARPEEDVDDDEAADDDEA